MEKKKLKVSFLLPGKGRSGAVRSTVRVGNELLLRGHDVRIFCRYDLCDLRDKLRRIYIKLRCGSGNDWLTTFKGNRFVYNKLHINEFSPDELIISMCSQTTLDMRSLPGNTGIKVLYCRGAEIENREQILKAWELPFSKLITSSHLAELIRTEAKQPVIGIVPNGVDTKEYFPSMPESERTGIGSIFGWSKSKDPTSIVQVMKMIGQRLPNSPRYLFSGARKPRGIKGVSFKRFPSLQEARRIYSSCRVWFLCSIAEGFGNPILEAMACGCAVVSTACGGPEDIIKDGENGFLVDVGNTQAMAHKIILLYKNEQLRKKICANAMKTVQEYSWPKAVDKLEKCLLSIYANNSRTTTRLYAYRGTAMV